MGNVNIASWNLKNKLQQFEILNIYQFIEKVCMWFKKIEDVYAIGYLRSWFRAP